MKRCNCLINQGTVNQKTSVDDVTSYPLEWPSLKKIIDVDELEEKLNPLHRAGRNLKCYSIVQNSIRQYSKINK